MTDPDGRVPVNRKYEIEFRIIIVVSPTVTGRQRELELIDKSVTENCHLYIVSRRPRMSIDPESVKFHGEVLELDLLVHRGPDVDRYPLLGAHRFPGTQWSWKSVWPHEYFEVVNEDGASVYGGYVGALIGKLQKKREAVALNEILYIGQAFGKEGERTAFDRLRSHSTLQRIYSEKAPDSDIWLTLCEIPDVTLFQDIDGVTPAQITGDADMAHATDVIERAHNPEFYTREALAMAEAGLIRYFMPTYNVMYRNNYPDPKHVHLSEAYDLDLVDLIVEFQGSNVDMSYGTSKQAASQSHNARFRLRETGGLAALTLESISTLPPDSAG